MKPVRPSGGARAGGELRVGSVSDDLGGGGHGVILSSYVFALQLKAVVAFLAPSERGHGLLWRF